MYGYNGRILIVNLSTQEHAYEPLDDSVLLRFIGGIGLGTYLLYRYCPPGTSPLSPLNPLIFATSPLVGSRLTTSSKFAVVTKSPLTGLIGDSLSSSFLATEIKMSGCDALVVTGKSKAPTLLSVSNGEVEFLSATDLMGLDTAETEHTVKNRLGRKTRVACIGPAGENLVKFASISNDGGRQAGRTGPGAVMGSKNLKAIAIRGSTKVPVHNPSALNKIGQNLTKRSLGPATEKYRTLGTLANLAVFNRLGTLPTLNFQKSVFESAENISGETLHKNHFVKNAHCANCTIGCEKIVSTTDGGKKIEGRMEYESAFALGSLLGISDPNTMIRASLYCDQKGIDTISAGGTIAWATECFERGIITLEDTGGIELRFASSQSMMSCLEMIVNRKDIGDLLAEGSRHASMVIGQGSEDWAMHVKGLELPGYEPRTLKTMALGMAVSTRGACHNRSSVYEVDFSSEVNRLEIDDNRGYLTATGEDYSAIMDSLIWCKFLRKAFDDFYGESSHIYELVTGVKLKPEKLKLAGERINNLKKLFNIREGWVQKDDTLPERILNEALPSGFVKGVGLNRSELHAMIASYYKARGWDKMGFISSDKIDDLALTDIVESQDPTVQHR